MERRELSKDELIGLIAEFRSEVRKCLAKIDIYNEKIEELTQLLGTVPTTYVENKPKRKPHKLSKWDEIVIDVIKENGRPTTSKEIYDRAMAKAAERGMAMEESRMKSKINQCLVKLSGRRDEIMKVKYNGRGFAYSLSNN